jgi:hypothetical protein
MPEDHEAALLSIALAAESDEEMMAGDDTVRLIAMMDRADTIAAALGIDPAKLAIDRPRDRMLILEDGRDGRPAA